MRLLDYLQNNGQVTITESIRKNQLSWFRNLNTHFKPGVIALQMPCRFRLPSVLNLSIGASRQAGLSRWQSTLLVNSFQMTYFKTATGPSAILYFVLLSARHNVSSHIDSNSLCCQHFCQPTLIKWKKSETLLQQEQDKVTGWKRSRGQAGLHLKLVKL